MDYVPGPFHFFFLSSSYLFRSTKSRCPFAYVCVCSKGEDGLMALEGRRKSDTHTHSSHLCYLDSPFSSIILLLSRSSVVSCAFFPFPLCSPITPNCFTILYPFRTLTSSPTAFALLPGRGRLLCVAQSLCLVPFYSDCALVSL